MIGRVTFFIFQSSFPTADVCAISWLISRVEANVSELALQVSFWVTYNFKWNTLPCIFIELLGRHWWVFLSDTLSTLSVFVLLLPIFSFALSLQATTLSFRFSQDHKFEPLGCFHDFWVNSCKTSSSGWWRLSPNEFNHHIECLIWHFWTSKCLSADHCTRFDVPVSIPSHTYFLLHRVF